MTGASNLELKYAGSVKNVFANDREPDFLWFSFTDQYSVFDWGQMPDLIANKGNALAIMGTHIFQKLYSPKNWQNLPYSPHLIKFDPDYLAERLTHPSFKTLQETGLNSHLVELVQGTPTDKTCQHWQNLETIFSIAQDGDNPKYLKAPKKSDQLLMKVRKAQVDWPKLEVKENRYIYPPINKNHRYRLVPLEVVFRFGMVEGSSLKHTLTENPDYISALGLKNLPIVNEWFPHPTIEFFTKLEPKDRLLPPDEAIEIAKLSKLDFDRLADTAKSIALALHVLFAERNLELWDGKLEFIFDNESNDLILADSVGPDELRLLYKGTHLSKELLRQYYRSSHWYNSLVKAQTIASKNGKQNWQEICKEQLDQFPQPLPHPIKLLADQLYGVLTNEVTGVSVFPDHPSFQDFITMVNTTFSNLQKEQINA